MCLTKSIILPWFFAQVMFVTPLHAQSLIPPIEVKSDQLREILKSYYGLNTLKGSDYTIYWSVGREVRGAGQRAELGNQLTDFVIFNNYIELWGALNVIGRIPGIGGNAAINVIARFVVTVEPSKHQSFKVDVDYIFRYSDNTGGALFETLGFPELKDKLKAMMADELQKKLDSFLIEQAEKQFRKKELPKSVELEIQPGKLLVYLLGRPKNLKAPTAEKLEAIDWSFLTTNDDNEGGEVRIIVFRQKTLPIVDFVIRQTTDRNGRPNTSCNMWAENHTEKGTFRLPAPVELADRPAFVQVILRETYCGRDRRSNIGWNFMPTIGLRTSQGRVLRYATDTQRRLDTTGRGRFPAHDKTEVPFTAEGNAARAQVFPLICHFRSDSNSSTSSAARRPDWIAPSM